MVDSKKEIAELGERIVLLEAELSACRGLRNRLQELREQELGVKYIAGDVAELRIALTTVVGSAKELP